MIQIKFAKLRAPAFKFGPFSDKQKKVLSWVYEGSPYKDYDAIIADGAVRSGKTISMITGFISWAQSASNGQNFGICGKTIGSLRRNVVGPLKQIVKAMPGGWTCIDRRGDNMLVLASPGIGGKININYFYLFGGKDEASQDLIQGITLKGCFFDEVALMPQSFVNQAVARCSVDGMKLWFNDNPQGPYHWFKLEWIDKAVQKNALYLHFDMNDNLTLSEKTKERYRAMFSGVFFKRYILGLWVMAEGLIYDMFDEERLVKHIDRDWEREFVSVDYGTQNPMTFGHYGTRRGHYHLIKTYYHSGKDSGKQKTDRQYGDEMIKFIANTDVRYITVDPSAASFIAELREREEIKERGIKIIPARNDVIPGIQAVSVKYQEGKFTMEPGLEEDLRELSSYVWDEKAAQRGEDVPLKENDHCMDRNRYAIYTDIKVFRTRENLSGRGGR